MNYTLVGCGNRSRFFVNRLSQLNCQLTAVYDSCEKRTALYPQTRHCRSYQDLLDFPSDFVAICTTANANAKLVALARKNNKNILVEKPLAQTPEDIRLLNQPSGEGIIQVANQENADQRYKVAKQIIESNAIGQIAWCNASWCRNNDAMDWKHEIQDHIQEQDVKWNEIASCSYLPEKYFRWRNYWEFSGGLITDSIYHKIAPLVSIFPKIPNRILCGGHCHDRETPNSVFIIIDYDSFSITLNGSNKSSFEQQDMIRGSQGTIIFDQDSAWTTPGPKSLTVKMEKRYGGKETHYPNSAGQEDVFENFINALRGNTPVCSGFYNHLRTSLIAIMAIEALRNNTVILPESWLVDKQLQWA